MRTSYCTLLIVSPLYSLVNLHSPPIPPLLLWPFHTPLLPYTPNKTTSLLFVTSSNSESPVSSRRSLRDTEVIHNQSVWCGSIDLWKFSFSGNSDWQLGGRSFRGLGRRFREWWGWVRGSGRGVRWKGWWGRFWWRWKGLLSLDLRVFIRFTWFGFASCYYFK